MTATGPSDDPAVRGVETVRIRGRHVVAYDAVRAGHVVVEGGEVVFRGDRILHAGGPYDGRVDREIDARTQLVIPGLVDAHALMDVGVHLLLWDRERDPGYRPRSFVEGSERAFTPERTRDGAEAMLSMLVRSGVTTFCGVNAMVFKRWHDEPWESELYADVANGLGLRAYLSHHFRASVPIVDDATATTLVDERRGFAGLERNVAFVQRAQRGDFGPRIHGLLFPYTQDTVTPDLLRATRAAADALGVGWRMHFAQSVAEVEGTLARHGRTPVEHLDDLGVLGRDVMLTHCLHGRGHAGGNGLSDDELAILARSGTNVGHTPWIYLWGGRVLDAFGRYRRAGINVAIGTDTYPGDMIQEMRMASLMGKVAERSPTAVTAADVFDAATLGGARFLGREDIGRLAPGAKADIVLVREDTATFAPTLDPIRSLVYYASIRDVSTVFVDGRPIMEDGVIPGVDEVELSGRMGALVVDVADLLVAWDARGRDLDARFGPSYPSVQKVSTIDDVP
ncbi:MAG: amidohydrolase family protein [Trueperaceae bacterium]|nr:amidohydrolase family protein [Trueperaceae bacterium]